MKSQKQLSLPGYNMKSARLSHGGTLGIGKRKTIRPIDRKQALHVVLRSSIATGGLSMLNENFCNHIDRTTKNIAKKWGVKLYNYANVGNHIHLLIRVPSRAIWQRFLRELAGTIAIIVTGAKKGASLAKNATGRGFWDHLVFTRIVKFGKDFNKVSIYFVKNIFEAAGIPIKKLLAKGLRILTIAPDGRIRI